MVTMQVPVPGQLTSDQPEKPDPKLGVAVSAMTELVTYDAEHVAPQSIPAGAEVTTPDPNPALVMVKV